MVLGNKKAPEHRGPRASIKRNCGCLIPRRLGVLQRVPRSFFRHPASAWWLASIPSGANNQRRQQLRRCKNIYHTFVLIVKNYLDGPLDATFQRRDSDCGGYCGDSLLPRLPQAFARKALEASILLENMTV